MLQRELDKERVRNTRCSASWTRSGYVTHAAVRARQGHTTPPVVAPGENVVAPGVMWSRRGRRYHKMSGATTKI